MQSSASSTNLCTLYDKMLAYLVFESALTARVVWHHRSNGGKTVVAGLVYISRCASPFSAMHSPTFKVTPLFSAGYLKQDLKNG